MIAVDAGWGMGKTTFLKMLVASDTNNGVGSTPANETAPLAGFHMALVCMNDEERDAAAPGIEFPPEFISIYECVLEGVGSPEKMLPFFQGYAADIPAEHLQVFEDCWPADVPAGVAHEVLVYAVSRRAAFGYGPRHKGGAFDRHPTTATPLLTI